MKNAWTIEEDIFIVRFYDAVGPFIGPHDLGRTEKAVTARAQKLKAKGGWELLRRAIEAQAEYNLVMHARSGMARELWESTADALRGAA
jgi:hypothetical protein